MLPKIMHHCAFLIITFSLTNILCIQNGKTVSPSFSTFSSSPSTSSSSSSSSFLPSSSSVEVFKRHFDTQETRQSFFNQNALDSSGFQPSTGHPIGFRFPDKHQYNTNSPNELPPSSLGYQNPYQNNREVANTNQPANPYNLALNTGEQNSPNNANNLNNYRYQQHANAIAGHTHHRSPSSNVLNANDFYLSRQQSPSPLYDYQHLNNKNPYYPVPSQYPNPVAHQPIQRRPTYAQGFGNYLFNGQPNYNNRQHRPTPPPPSPHGSQSSYSPYQDGHLTGPYPYEDLTSESGPSTTFPYQYANQFGNFGSGSSGFGTTPTTGTTNPLGSLLNSIGGPFAGANPLSMQIIRGLENIARNDDLQCVPKVLCQMLGSPTRRPNLPSFITSPVLTRFVASLPPLSPALIYGRAALLGLSGGEYSCARTYNKCPEDEDEILFYLNNHRGGFFKFFNEPHSQDAEHQFTTQPSSSPSHQHQQSAEPSIFNFLTGLGPSSSTSQSTSTNTNQENESPFMSEAVTNGIGSLFGNIISGFLNGQRQLQGQATRRNDDEVDDDKNPKKYSDLIESNSTTTDPDEGQVEGRILNNKSNILAAYVEPSSEQHDNPISFPLENSNDNYETQQFQSEFRFPNTPDRDAPQDSRKAKRVNFIDDSSGRPYSYDDDERKMIFPDRTGTGDLRFDNEEYFRVGKILNRPFDYNRGYRERERAPTAAPTTTTRRPLSYYTGQNAGSYNRYTSKDYYRHDYSQYKKQNQEMEEDTSGNVYVTNGQGVIEYYINANGKKIYV